MLDSNNSVNPISGPELDKGIVAGDRGMRCISIRHLEIHEQRPLLRKKELQAYPSGIGRLSGAVVDDEAQVGMDVVLALRHHGHDGAWLPARLSSTMRAFLRGREIELDGSV